MGVSALAFHDRPAAADRSSAAGGAFAPGGQRPGLDDTEAAVVAANETEAALARIAALPSGQAEVVLLRVLAGFEVADVAKIVGKKPGAVRVLQHRALQRLAEQLAREGKPVTR